MLAVSASPALAGPGSTDLRFSTVTGPGDVPLNVVEAGPAGAPGILLLHGFSQTHLSFGAQFDDPVLTRDFHLVAFDLRGHGNSGKPWAAADYTGEVLAGDVAAVIEATGLRRPVIVAWSFGGLVAMHYVRRFGATNLAGLNLTGTVGQLVPPPPPAPGTPPVDAEWVRRMLSDSLADNLLAAERSVDLLVARPMPPAWRERTLRAAMTMPAYAKRAIGPTMPDNADLAPKLTIPVLFSAGARDAIAPVAMVQPAAATLPNASVSIYADAGHSPFAEAPERFNRELAAFTRAAAGAPAAP
jgi:pimeloyl-ACP methyl ester carboxylesterase